MSFSPEILEILVPSTNEDQNISGRPPEVPASPKKRTPSSRRCKVILDQASSMVDKDTTPESLNPDTSQLKYKGSSTRGQFLGVGDYNSYSPPNIDFSDDDSMDAEYVPVNWHWGNKKQKYEEDREWKPKSKKVKRIKGSKKDSSINNRVVKCENEIRSPTEFPNSIMGNSLKRKGKSAESRKTNLDDFFKCNLFKLKHESDAENQKNANVTSANSFVGNLLKRRQDSDEKQNTNLASTNNSFMVNLSKSRVESVENQNSNLMSANSSFLSSLRKRREKSAEKKNTNLLNTKNSFMGNFPKRTAESAENQNTYLMSTTKKPREEITDEIVLDMSNSSSACSTKLSESPAMSGFGNEETTKMPKFVPENTSLSKWAREIINGKVTNIDAIEKFHHMEAQNNCRYCDTFIELDVLTILAVADLEKSPEVFVNRIIQKVKKMHEILENVQPKGDEVNLKLRMAEKTIDNLKTAKQLLLKHKSFINLSKSLMKTTSEPKIVQIIEEVQID